MGLLDRLFGRGDREQRTEALLVESGLADASGPDELVEIEVVGEASYQDAIERIAGPKGPDGKQLRVGVTLRREPENSYDANAVRVEVMGTLVGYVSRLWASKVSLGLQSVGGAIETQGLVVGGWRDRDSEGHFGVRVWFDSPTAARLGLARQVWPTLPGPAAGETRLSPMTDDRSQLTVTCEEHYQATLESTRPTGWLRDRWPILVSFNVVDSNPHAKTASRCIEVRLYDSAQTIGYLTPAMSDRHIAPVSDALASGSVPTAEAVVSPGTKGGATFLRVKAVMPK